MTKKDQIMALHREGRTTRQIACEVYGLPLDAPKKVADRKMAYIRVVIRQRKGTSQSAADVTYLVRKYGSVANGHRVRNAGQRDYRSARHKRLYHTDPAWRQRKLDREKAYYWKMKAARESAMHA